MVMTILTGCGNQENAETASSETAAEQPAPEPAGPPTGMINGHFVADKDYSNLPTDPTIAVYDAYTLEERLAAGLPTQAPEVPHYFPPEGEKIAYLTFDDGPEGVITPKILDILKENGIKATFYVTGQSCEAHPEVLKRIFEEGHAIGHHSYNHQYKEIYPDENNFLAQLVQTEAIIKNIIGVRPIMLRAPGGADNDFNKRYRPFLLSKGYIEHDWNSANNDAVRQNVPASELISTIKRTTGDFNPSAIILMHCCGGHMATADTLQQCIDIIKGKGYTFGVMSPMTPQPREERPAPPAPETPQAK